MLIYPTEQVKVMNGVSEEDSALKISTTVRFAIVGSDFDVLFLDDVAGGSGRASSGSSSPSCVISTISNFPGKLVDILLVEGTRRRFLRLIRLVG